MLGNYLCYITGKYTNLSKDPTVPLNLTESNLIKIHQKLQVLSDFTTTERRPPMKTYLKPLNPDFYLDAHQIALIDTNFLHVPEYSYQDSCIICWKLNCTILGPFLIFLPGV